MRKTMNKVFKALTLALFVCSLFSTNVFAAEVTQQSNIQSENNNTEAQLQFIAPEQMEQIISEQPSDIAMASNWFPDVVLVTVKRQSDGHCRVVFMNNGFPFDRCDIDGVITLYDMSGNVVANRTVAEHKLVYGVARVLDIYPVGGKYATGSYSLVLSDGGTGTPYTGGF